MLLQVHAKPDTQHPLVFTYSRDELPLKSLDGLLKLRSYPSPTQLNAHPPACMHPSPLKPLDYSVSSTSPKDDLVPSPSPQPSTLFSPLSPSPETMAAPPRQVDRCEGA
jgi:hypothetical protein